MSLGNVLGYRQVGSRVLVEAERGTVTLRFVDEHIVNVFMPVESTLQDSKAVEQRVLQEVALMVVECEVNGEGESKGECKESGEADSKGACKECGEIESKGACKGGGKSESNILCNVGGNVESNGKVHHSMVLLIKTNRLIVEVRSPFGLVFKDLQGNVINEDFADRGISLEEPIGVYKVLQPEEHFYGFGEKTGFIDKRGDEMTMWCSDIPEPHVPSMQALYKSIPFFIGLQQGRAYGIFFDNTYKTHFDMGKRSHKYYSFTAAGGNIDYYFIYGPAMKEVVQGYTELTGRMDLPPLWALGYQQCRWGYYPENRVMEIVENFRLREIPCDVIYLDIDYMDGYRVFTWDDERFPNPQAMTDRLREQGFKIVTIVDPGVKKDADYPVYQELLEQGLYVTDRDGLPFVGKVWPGECLFPDFTDAATRRWWGEKHKALLDAGVAGIWNDMNEPAVFTEGHREPDEYKTMPKSNMHKNDGHPASHAAMHNIYGLMMSRSTYEGLRRLSEKRPFIVTRAAYAGVQKYAALWTGDNQSFWDHLGMALPMCMNLGLSGVAFIGTDVGGFGFDCTAELLSRWVQVGCFTPFFRNHSAWDTRAQEPWAFDEQTEEINRKYIRLRYRLLPYTYNLFVEAKETGLPVMRPLVLEYPEDEATYRVSDQFLWGANLLVAPVTTPGTEYRHVYLPEGEWVDYWTGERFAGRSHMLVHAPLDTLPLFVKSGSIIPNYPPMQYVGERQVETVILDIYPGNGEYRFYEDDGETYGYEGGLYNLTEFTMTAQDGEVVLRGEEKAAGYAEGVQNFLMRFNGLRGWQVVGDGQEISDEVCGAGSGEICGEEEACGNALVLKVARKNVWEVRVRRG